MVLDWAGEGACVTDGLGDFSKLVSVFMIEMSSELSVIDRIDMSIGAVLPRLWCGFESIFRYFCENLDQEFRIKSWCDMA